MKWSARLFLDRDRFGVISSGSTVGQKEGRSVPNCRGGGHIGGSSWMATASKEEVIRKAYDNALVYTPQCRSCSRGTVLALMDAFDIKDQSVFKAATGLHGGIGGVGDVCGSLLGASLVLGLVCGSPQKRSSTRDHKWPVC